MKKKIIAGFMLATMIISLTACGSNKDTTSSNDTENKIEESEESESEELESTESESAEQEAKEPVTIEDFLALSDYELLDYARSNPTNSTQVCISDQSKTFSNHQSYTGHKESVSRDGYSIYGIETEGTESYSALQSALIGDKYSYEYEMFIFPTYVSNMTTERDITVSGSVYSVGTDAIDYYGQADSRYTRINQMSGIKLFILPSPICIIESFAFSEMSEVERIVLSDSVKYIDYEAFTNCTGLKTINLPSSIEYIREGAFEGCDNLVATVDRGSYADTFCKESGIKVTYKGEELIDDAESLAEWKLAYISYLSQFNSEDIKFTLLDINKDGIPELFSENYSDYAFVCYDVASKKPVLIGDGMASYKGDIVVTSRDHSGGGINSVFQYNSSSHLFDVLSEATYVYIKDDATSDIIGCDYYLDDNKITEDEYQVWLDTNCGTDYTKITPDKSKTEIITELNESY